MATPPVFSGQQLLQWAQRTADELNRRRVEINELNVFPVPDADTGSNMAYTMSAAVEEASHLETSASAQQVAEALAVGAVKGARGNSGLVLSQVMRGLAQAVARETPGGAIIADTLSAAVSFVDRAIADPVEGTVITVLRAAAVAAAEAAKYAADPAAPTIAEVAGAATEAARVALAHTPSQLDVLREAGVVDAGGAGLVVLLEALDPAETSADEYPSAGSDSLVQSSGTQITTDTALPSHSTVMSHDTVTPHGMGAALEVLFMFTGDLDELERQLQPLGDSIVIARLGEDHAKVHIHSREAGAVIERAVHLGDVSQLRLETLPPGPTTQAPERLLVAVTPPGSLARLYESAGAVTVQPGEDVVAEILSAIRRLGASEVLLLPNGLLDRRNLAAVENAARAFEQTVTILPTVRLVSGIAALTVHDAQQPLATAAYSMSEAAGEMRTAVAQRDSDGSVVVTAHGETVASDPDAVAAVARTCRRMLEHGGEQVSVLFDPLEINRYALAALGGELDIDVMVYPADGLGVVAEIGVE